MLNVHLASIELRTWTTTILGNFRSLWLKMEGENTLHQNLVNGFKSFSSYKLTSKLCKIAILRKLDHNIIV
jgi:hypothetical protein